MHMYITDVTHLLPTVRCSNVLTLLQRANPVRKCINVILSYITLYLWAVTRLPTGPLMTLWVSDVCLRVGYRSSE